MQFQVIIDYFNLLEDAENGVLPCHLSQVSALAFNRSIAYLA